MRTWPQQVTLSQVVVKAVSFELMESGTASHACTVQRLLLCAEALAGLSVLSQASSCTAVILTGWVRACRFAVLSQMRTGKLHCYLAVPAGQCGRFGGVHFAGWDC